jgi:hypothetical protein
MALAHAIENKVEAAYRRGDLFEKRRELMNAWAGFCMAPSAGTVTPIRSAETLGLSAALSIPVGIDGARQSG